MESESTGGLATAAGVSTNVPDSSPESQTQSAQDPIKNVKAEMNRKFSKLDQKLEQLMSAVTQGRAAAPVDETDEDAPDYARYFDTRLKQTKAAEAEVIHQKDFQEAVTVFPELNQDADNFDPVFYKEVDKVYTKLRKADPTDASALKDAIELVAAKTGRNERLIQERLIKDEARRSRILSEGIATPKDQKKSQEPTLNEQALAKIKISGKSLERLKQELKTTRKGE